MIKKLRSSKAFTLIELLIVVVIIAILVGIGVPALLDARSNAQASKRETVLSSLATAKSRFELDNPVSEIQAFNDETDDDTRFGLIQQYLTVSGTTPADRSALVAGTGFDNQPEALEIGNLSTFDDLGAFQAPPVAPVFNSAAID